MDSDRCGATACVAIITYESNQKVLYVANVGDTRAVLNKNGRGERISKDHKTTDPQEFARIKAFGG
jgi:protein phosphatase 2C family protein 2/3